MRFFINRDERVNLNQFQKSKRFWKGIIVLFYLSVSFNDRLKITSKIQDGGIFFGFLAVTSRVLNIFANSLLHLICLLYNQILQKHVFGKPK
jgi:hypothetical protein